MNKVLYIVDEKKDTNYQYNICEDTVIYHFSIDSSSKVEINLLTEGVNLYYYYNNINYGDHFLNIRVNHKESNTHSEVYNHGVNVKDGKLDYYVEGIVPKNSSHCICNQENQIMNMMDGKSTIFPSLLIDNYDVDSNHSAYIGKLSEEKLFYMMSRGLTEEEANHLLLNGFLINSDSIDLSKIKKFIKEIKKI